MPMSNGQARFALITVMLLPQLLTLIEEIFFVKRFCHWLSNGYSMLDAV
jgi:hypothetical protein